MHEECHADWDANYCDDDGEFMPGDFPVPARIQNIEEEKTE